MMGIENLTPAEGSNSNRKRVGRGQGSGHGGTSTRGHKGQKSRSGYKSKIGFEGGQMPLQRRVPKFGFKNINRVEYKSVNLDTLQYLIDNKKATEITPEFLAANGFASKNDRIKIIDTLEEYNDIATKKNTPSLKHHLIVLSAKNEERLSAYAVSLLDYLKCIMIIFTRDPSG